MTSVLLIFGTCVVGKSTLAERFATALGWQVASTDKMGRHPGRPWPEVREPVAEYYAKLSDETINWFLRVHHENIWPHIRHRIIQASSGGEGAVFEGSALRPEFIAEMDHPDLMAIGLYAEETFLRERIRLVSGYAQWDTGRQSLIDKFITRSLLQNAEIVQTANQLGLKLLDVADTQSLDHYADELIATLGMGL
ncbi:MAG TPA: hypothetical protein VGM83_14295 [Devosiaceae bacterium]|jgi:2-phosphoglycerate kinase